MKKDIKIGDRVSICGSVFYGDKDYKVCCDGIVEVINDLQMLVLVDEIDGDRNVCTYVGKNIINGID